MRLAFLLTIWLLSFGQFVRADEARIEFNRQIRPLLSEKCFRCHGPDARQRKADLRLDTAAGATAKREGGAAIIPGKPDDSELIRRVTSDDEAERMPPPGAGKPISPEQSRLFRQWIAEGAEYQPHWSSIPPRRPALPPVKN